MPKKMLYSWYGISRLNRKQAYFVVCAGQNGNATHGKFNRGYLHKPKSMAELYEVQRCPFSTFGIQLCVCNKRAG